MILSICYDPNVMKILRIINIIINIIRIAVPIMLIIVVSIDFMKAVMGDNKAFDEAKKGMIAKVISAVIIFLVPTIINVVIYLAGIESFEGCFRKITMDEINERYESVMEELVSDAEEKIENDSYTKAQIYLKYITDRDKFKEYSDRLDSTYDKIVEKQNNNSSSNSGSTNNSGGATVSSKYTIFMGDSRTNGMKSKIDSNYELVIAKDGGNYNDYLNHESQVMQILGNNDKSYNIVLNYGVNDLRNVEKYCSEYNSFVGSVGSKNKVIIMSVNPVNDDISHVTNDRIVAFNNRISSCVSNVKYCDVYNKASISVWKSSYIKSDGVHYTSDGYQFIYNEIKKCIR